MLIEILVNNLITEKASLLTKAIFSLNIQHKKTFLLLIFLPKCSYKTAEFSTSRIIFVESKEMLPFQGKTKIDSFCTKTGLPCWISAYVIILTVIFTHLNSATNSLFTGRADYSMD